jgi:tRNA threonylcarbamoyl adenosine modification protein YeaZ
VDAVNILSIETATTACAIGLRTSDGDTLRVLDEMRRHTEVLAPGIDSVLREHSLKARDLDRVVIDIGPGLFTGLRVGVATAIALSQGLGCDLVAVTSLELLAYGAWESGIRGSLVACVDGRRGEVFVQTYRLGDDVELVDLAHVSTARNVVIEWATNGAPVTFSGDGVERYRTDFAAVPNGAIFDQSIPSQKAALDLCERRQPSEMVAPLYLREADAVANFSTRERPHE